MKNEKVRLKTKEELIKEGYKTNEFTEDLYLEESESTLNITKEMFQYLGKEVTIVRKFPGDFKIKEDNEEYWYCYDWIDNSKPKQTLDNIVLQEGDLVTFESGSYIIVSGYDGMKAWEISHNSNKIMSIKRPKDYDTIYERKADILNKEEKEYLKGIIKPFRDRVRYIEKCGTDYEEFWIMINIKKDEFINLPYFEKGTMYVGMEAEKPYTLEELGL